MAAARIAAEPWSVRLMRASWDREESEIEVRIECRTNESKRVDAINQSPFPPSIVENTVPRATGSGLEPVPSWVLFWLSIQGRTAVVEQ